MGTDLSKKYHPSPDCHDQIDFYCKVGIWFTLFYFVSFFGGLIIYCLMGYK